MSKSRRAQDRQRAAGALQARPAGDESLVARWLSILRSGGDARRRKARRTRAAIRARRYENPLKLDVAVDRLLDDLKT